eukprot:6023626-Amphidinium_carterae.1
MCYFKERSRQRAAKHRVSEVAARADERQALEKQWHDKVDAEKGPRAVGYYGLTHAARREFKQDEEE